MPEPLHFDSLSIYDIDEMEARAACQKKRAYKDGIARGYLLGMFTWFLIDVILNSMAFKF